MRSLLILLLGFACGVLLVGHYNRANSGISAVKAVETISDSGAISDPGERAVMPPRPQVVPQVVSDNTPAKEPVVNGMAPAPKDQPKALGPLGRLAMEHVKWSPSIGLSGALSGSTESGDLLEAPSGGLGEFHLDLGTLEKGAGTDKKAKKHWYLERGRSRLDPAGEYGNPLERPAYK